MAVPADYYGGRAITKNPLVADSLTNAGDSAAANLKFIYLLEQANLVPAANKPILDEIKEDYKAILKNTEVVKARERDTRVQRPLTKVPVADYGVETDITKVKVQNWQIFTGEKCDAGAVTRWLQRSLGAAEGQKLTLKATSKLLMHMSTGVAQNYIEHLLDEGKTLREIIELLEMRWGGLEAPEVARAACGSIQRKPDEPLSVFLDRLRHTARVACRYEDDDEKRIKDTDDLVKANIRRVLPPSVKSQYEERLQNMRKMGAVEPTSRDIESECLKMEQAREEKKQEMARRLSQYGPRKGKFANLAVQSAARIDELVDLDSDSDPEVHPQADELSPPASEDEDPEVEREIFLAKQIVREKEKFQRRGQPIDQKRVMKGVIRKYNARYPQKDQPRVVGEIAQPVNYPRPYYNPQQANIGGQNPVRPLAAPQRVQQPPNAVPELRRRPITELIALSNCDRGQCVQCGLRGHLLGRDGCPLKDKPLMDAPCNVCHQGLHAGNDCVRIFQQDFVPPGGQLANQLEELHLN